jgi:hypothetical protein
MKNLDGVEDACISYEGQLLNQKRDRSANSDEHESDAVPLTSSTRRSRRRRTSAK